MLTRLINEIIYIISFIKCRLTQLKILKKSIKYNKMNHIY